MDDQTAKIVQLAVGQFALSRINAEGGLLESVKNSPQMLQVLLLGRGEDDNVIQIG